MNWPAKKKGVASEGSTSAAAELLKHSELMREMDSPNGAWNPEPDAHITATLRDDVELSPNETKLIAYVKFCCSRLKSGGRSAWGKTEGGKPLTITRIADYFGWDTDNARKHAKKPIAYGFVRVRQKPTGDEFGLGARVDGKYTPELAGRTNSEYADSPVCTYRIPPYLLVDLQRLTRSEREKFLQGWSSRKEAAQQRLNDAVAACRTQEQAELSEHCKAFGLELKVGKKRRLEMPASRDADGATAHDGKPDVHTQGVRTEEVLRYNGASESANTLHVRTQTFSDTEPSTITLAEEEVLVEVVAALSGYGTPSDKVARELIAECRNKAADCTGDEIAYFIHEKAKLMKPNVANRIYWLKRAVPECFEPVSLNCYRADVLAAAEREAEKKAAEEESARQMRDALSSGVCLECGNTGRSDHPHSAGRKTKNEPCHLCSAGREAAIADIEQMTEQLHGMSGPVRDSNEQKLRSFALNWDINLENAPAQGNGVPRQERPDDSQLKTKQAAG